MNDGIVIGVVRDAATGQPVWNATAQLTSIRGEPGLPAVRLYDQNGGGGWVRADTDEDGFFALRFSWEPTQIGNVQANPQYRLVVFTTNRQRNGDLVDNGYEQVEVTDQQLCTVVSLRPLQTGDLPEFGEVDDVLKSKTLG